MEFKDNPDILNSMRLCLVFMAEMKNVKLKHKPSDYDMETMLKMMEEMEGMPMYRSPKERLKDFVDKVIWYFAHGMLWSVRGLMFIIASVSGPEAKEATKKFKADHDKLRKG